ncbi:MAG: hypothetical protein L7F77_11635 [Candidatus Magnetominusculus sp. LBB02]|nr:hypothetical protein [Candidatus Magnetominusculus sp. LBB02]
MLKIALPLAITLVVCLYLTVPPLTLTNSVASHGGKVSIAALDVCHTAKAFMADAGVGLTCPSAFEHRAFIVVDNFQTSSEHISTPQFPFTKDQPPKFV